MVSAQEGRRLLLLLADFLDKLDPARFDYTDWVGDSWEGKQDLSCGTTACAMGWACTMPEFRALGLRLGKHGTPVLVKDNLAPEGLGGLGWICEEIFGDNNVWSLFIPDSVLGEGRNTHPAYVAAKIRRWVDSHAVRT
jgi:hypothetical protein